MYVYIIYMCVCQWICVISMHIKAFFLHIFAQMFASSVKTSFSEQWDTMGYLVTSPSRPWMQSVGLEVARFRQGRSWNTCVYCVQMCTVHIYSHPGVDIERAMFETIPILVMIFGHFMNMSYESTRHLHILPISEWLCKANAVRQTYWNVPPKQWTHF